LPRRPVIARLASIARGRRWLNELITDATTNVESFAKREQCSVRKVNLTISLAFVAPISSKPLLTAHSHTAWVSPALPICRPNGRASFGLTAH
jgi:hypothetical protein